MGSEAGSVTVVVFIARDSNAGKTNSDEELVHAPHADMLDLRGVLDNCFRQLRTAPYLKFHVSLSYRGALCRSGLRLRLFPQIHVVIADWCQLDDFCQVLLIIKGVCVEQFDVSMVH